MGRVALILACMGVLLAIVFLIVRFRKTPPISQTICLAATMLLNIFTMVIYSKTDHDNLTIMWATIATINALALANTIRNYLINRANDCIKKTTDH